MFKKALVLSLFLLLPVCFVQAVTIPTQLTIISGLPQTLDVDATSTVITVEAQDSLNNPANVISTTYVNLVSDSATGVFSSKSASECGTDWTKTQITIASSSARKSFCYKDYTPGTFTITVSDSVGVLASSSKTIIINATSTPDTTAPVITLLGDAVVNLTVGDTYTDAGVTVMDDVDGVLTASTTSIVVTGLPIDTSASSTQYVIYTATDSSSNSASSTRTINISDPAPVVAPVADPVVSHSSGGTGYVQNISYLLATPSPVLTEGLVLGTSTSRVITDPIRLRRLNYIRARLIEIRGHLIFLQHPELRELFKTTGTATVSEAVSPASTTESQDDQTEDKPWWKFW
jgi:hypothetical protein